MDSGFKILHRLIKAADVRQRIVSSNIANADTPGYKARDVKFGNMLEKEMKLKSTNPKHMSSENSIKMWNQFVIEENPSWGDRNNVELNVEMAKMTENSLYHNAAIKILNAKIKMFKSAISIK
jgi:flagellar basal-body rod protein FlgB